MKKCFKLVYNYLSLNVALGRWIWRGDFRKWRCEGERWKRNWLSVSFWGWTTERYDINSICIKNVIKNAINMEIIVNEQNVWFKIWTISAF